MNDMGDTGGPEGGHLQYFGSDPWTPGGQKKGSKL